MTHSFVTSTSLWKVDTTGTIQTSATDAVVQKVVFVPTLASDDLVIHSGQDKEAIALKGNMSNLHPIQIDFGVKGRRFKGLKIQTIDGGTAWIYLVKS